MGSKIWLTAFLLAVVSVGFQAFPVSLDGNVVEDVEILEDPFNFKTDDSLDDLAETEDLYEEPNEIDYLRDDEDEMVDWEDDSDETGMEDPQSRRKKPRRKPPRPSSSSSSPPSTPTNPKQRSDSRNDDGMEIVKRAMLVPSSVFALPWQKNMPLKQKRICNVRVN
ncbi:hypothetical protein ACROYT_G022771 [Oculina patagonica]